MADPPEYFDLFAQWERQGLLSKDQVLKRLDDQMHFYHYYSPDEQDVIANFDIIIKTNRSCDESAFITFLTDRFPPTSASIAEAAPILYTSATYLARFPFVEDPQPLLTLAALKRALLLSSVCSNCWIQESTCYSVSTGEFVGCRGRTEVDYIRIIFQSIASPEPRNYSNTELEMIETIPKSGTPNNDEDGDELYHDVLDVLSATLPLEVWEIHPSRDQLRPLAKSLWSTDLRLSHYRIDRNKLKTFIKPLIALAFRTEYVKIVEFTDSEHDEVANHVVNAFELGQRVISWPAFCTTMRTTVSIYILLQIILTAIAILVGRSPPVDIPIPCTLKLLFRLELPQLSENRPPSYCSRDGPVEPCPPREHRLRQSQTFIPAIEFQIGRSLRHSAK